ncbi:hypothetical protein [Kitasatospora sp. NPDC056184]|uniref:hypothetical protein n=1 Tax=Kitasatospora sp. NPDC056184 TaxID=3345738 RepID=UPI0035D9A21E
MFADLLGTLAMMAAPALTTDLRAVAAAAFAGGRGGALRAVSARTVGQRLVPDAVLGPWACHVTGADTWQAGPLRGTPSSACRGQDPLCDLAR